MGRHVGVAKLKIPDYIHLPDGRKILVKDIMVKPRDRYNYNLKTGHVSSGHSRRPKTIDKQSKT
jgi:hypothetical protein